MKTTNFEAETWFQRPETPSRVLEPLGTKINFAAYHRSDAMVAKKVEYRSGSQIWRYGRFASDGLCRLSGVAAGLPDTSAPPQMASGGHDGLQTPSIPGVWKPAEVARRVPDTSSTQTASGVAQGLQGLRAPREESGGHQGSCRASRHLSALRPGDMGRARLPCATRHPDVLQKATRSSNTAKPPILYTNDLWRPVRRLNGLPDNFAHPTGPLKTARHRQTKPDKTLSSI